VPFEDAQQLAGLVSAVSKMSQPADARLLESIWRPIREFHDKAAAQAELTAAQHPLPEVPSTAYGALADIIGQEADQLNDDERLARASAVLNAALATRTAAREQRIAAARDQVAAAETAAAERAAVTR
jgi:hypothetical protein